MAPLLLHFISIVPQDWRFRFLGSPESVAFINQTLPIQQYEKLGKLDLFILPNIFKTGNGEQVSQTLTTPAFWSHIIAPARHILMFQTDSILCANADKTIDHFTSYAYVGAPWKRRSYGGNGGLSLRRVDAMLNILAKYERHVNSDPEDVWLSKRLTWVKENKVFPIAYQDVAKEFSVESVWTERPLGYHIGKSGKVFVRSIWGSEERVESIMRYCPEVKIIMDSDVLKLSKFLSCSEKV